MATAKKAAAKKAPAKKAKKKASPKKPFGDELQAVIKRLENMGEIVMDGKGAAQPIHVQFPIGHRDECLANLRKML